MDEFESNWFLASVHGKWKKVIFFRDIPVAFP